MEILPEPSSPVPKGDGLSSIWAIPILMIGLMVVGICVLLPQWQSNRQLTAERDKLKHDLDYVQTQVEVNDRFLQSVGDDPGLAERLAQRQMQQIRKGTSVLELKSKSGRSPISPYALVSIGQPEQEKIVPPPRGVLASMCDSPRRQLYFTGIGLFMIAAGLVLGSSFQTSRT